MNPSIISLVPPIVLFVVACVSGNILRAFGVGILAALIIIANANPVRMISLFATQVYAYVSDPNVIILFLFLICIGAIITILSTVKERIIFKEKKEKRASFIKTSRMSEYASMFFSFLFSIDDYLSILTVGFIANQFAKKFTIPKERIAYFVHSLSGPLVILIPISSWAAEIISQLYQAGVHASSTPTTVIATDPLFLYAQSMGYNFYSLMTIFSVLFFVQSQIDLPQQITPKQKNSSPPLTASHIPAFDIALPLALLLLSTFIGLLYTGDCFIFGGHNSIFGALSKNNATFYVLFISSFIAFVSLFFYELKQKNVRLSEASFFVSGGFNLMKNAIALVSLASIFSAFVRRDLMTGVYLANTLLVYIGHSFIPFAVFVTSLLVALSTGTSWGTFALMIPLIVQMLTSVAGITSVTVAEQIPFLLPSLGAIFSGGVCGDHISPFSETTVMTATVTEISPMQHSKSQIFYALPAIISTTLLFVLIGFMPHVMTSLPVAIATGCLLCLIFIFFVKYLVKRKW